MNGRKKKDQYFFRSPDHRVLLFAGFYRQYEGSERFVILTTQANASLEGIHHRMPLILEPEEAESWMFDSEATDILLHKSRGFWKRGKGQLSLLIRAFWLPRRPCCPPWPRPGRSCRLPVRR